MAKIKSAAAANPADAPKKKVENTLNLKVKLHQKTIKKTIQEIDWNRGSDAPIVVELDPTTACNLACPDCISRELLNQGGFSNERLKELGREMTSAGVKAVILIGGGEPLAHPEIGWLIDHLGKHGVQLGLTTNGLLMNRHMKLIAQYMNWTRVSMDAGTSETFGRIRPDRSGKSQFSKAVDNMRMLAKMKNGKLGYSFMIFSEGKFDPRLRGQLNGKFTNVPEIFEAAKLAKDIGCEYFEVKPMYDINHYSIVQDEELMKLCHEEVAKALELQDETFKVLLATKMKHVMNNDGNLEPKDYHRCAVSELRTLITPSGAYVCPYFRGNPTKKIGDATKIPLKELWRGEQRTKVMAKLDPSKDCRMHCIRHESNMMIEEMVKDKSKLDEVETIEDFDFFI